MASGAYQPLAGGATTSRDDKKDYYIRTLIAGRARSKESDLSDLVSMLKAKGMSEAWIQDLIRAAKANEIFSDESIQSLALLAEMERQRQASSSSVNPSLEATTASTATATATVMPRMASPLARVVRRLQTPPIGVAEAEAFDYEPLQHYIDYLVEKLIKTYQKANKNADVLVVLWFLLKLKFESLTRGDAATNLGGGAAVEAALAQRNIYTIRDWACETLELLSALTYGGIYLLMAMYAAEPSMGYASVIVGLMSFIANTWQIAPVSPAGLIFFKGGYYERLKDRIYENLYITYYEVTNRTLLSKEVKAVALSILTAIAALGLSVVGAAPIAATSREALTRYIGDEKTVNDFGYFAWGMRTCLIFNALLIVFKMLKNEVQETAWSFKKQSLASAMIKMLLKVVAAIAFAIVYTSGQIGKVPGYLATAIPSLGTRYPELSDSGSTPSQVIQYAAFVPLIALNVYYIMSGAKVFVEYAESLRVRWKVADSMKQFWNSSLVLLSTLGTFLCLTGYPGVALTDSIGLVMLISFACAVISNWGATIGDPIVAALTRASNFSDQFTIAKRNFDFLEAEAREIAPLTAGAATVTAAAVPAPSAAGAATVTAAAVPAPPAPAAVTAGAIILREQEELTRLSEINGSSLGAIVKASSQETYGLTHRSGARAAIVRRLSGEETRQLNELKREKDAVIEMDKDIMRYKDFHGLLAAATGRIQERVTGYVKKNSICASVSTYLLRVATMGYATRPEGQTTGEWAGSFFCCRRRVGRRTPMPDGVPMSGGAAAGASLLAVDTGVGGSAATVP